MRIVNSLTVMPRTIYDAASTAPALRYGFYIQMQAVLMSIKQVLYPHYIATVFLPVQEEK